MNLAGSRYQVAEIKQVADTRRSVCLFICSLISERPEGSV